MLFQPDVTDHAHVGGVTTTQREFTSGFFHHVNSHIGAIRRRTLRGGYIHTLEEAQILHRFLGVFLVAGCVGVTLSKRQLAAHHVILRDGVAVHVNTLNVMARAFAHIKQQVYNPLFRIAGNGGAYLRKRMPFGLKDFLHIRGVILHGLAIVPLVREQLDILTQRFSRHMAQAGADIHLTQTVAHTFIHGEGDVEGLPIRREFAFYVLDLKIHKPVAQVKPAQQFRIVFNTFGVVLIG